MKACFFIILILVFSFSVSAESYNSAVCQEDIVCALYVPECNQEFVINWAEDPSPCYLHEFINCAAKLAENEAPVQDELLLCSNENVYLRQVTKKLSRKVRKLRKKLKSIKEQS